MRKQSLLPLDIGRVEERSVVVEMQESYLDYAMSVIIARALPDVRDGLKPVHRRILVTLNDLGLSPGAHFRKCAKICGDVSGNYHPHGESIVYPSLARLAQDFSLRYPLVAGQGNFGSIDGDPPAAMRYTEARMTHIAEELLTDLKKDTVDFQPNYDETRKEPKVLPAKVPQLIINGTVGIAVGMASSIPPHNLSEVCDAIIHLIDHADASGEDLMQFVKGPDFPTGGIVYDKKEIKQAYLTGKGRIVMRGRGEIVPDKTGQFQIIISELPYQVNKATFLERIAELVRNKSIESIRDLRDESSSDGIRIVIELKKDAYPNKVLNQLYKLTSLQDTFYVNMLAIVDGIQPRVLTLKMILEEYVKHRREVVTRRTTFDLKRAEERAHILEGLMIALTHIDAMIHLIKESDDREQAKTNLMKKYHLSELQAVAILEMRLQNLAHLESSKVETELKEKKSVIRTLSDLLKSPKKILGVIQQEVIALKEKFGNARRTKIIPHAVDILATEDLIPDEPTIVIITKSGYIKRLPIDTFKPQLRGGKGVIGLATKEEDVVKHLFSTVTHADLLFFTSTGRVFQMKVYDIPQAASRIAAGQALVNFLQLGMGESVTSVLHMDRLGTFKYLVMVTKNGVMKRVEIQAFAHVRRNGLLAITLRNGDRLLWVKPSQGKDEIMLITRQGKSIRLKETAVRSMGRGATGVRGIKLRGNDEVVGMDIIPLACVKQACHVIVVTEQGFGKQSALADYKVQGRGGFGLKTARLTEKTGKIVYGEVVIAGEQEESDMVIISSKGQVIRLPLKSVPKHGRDTQGVRLMRFRQDGDHVASVTFIS